MTLPDLLRLRWIDGWKQNVFCLCNIAHLSPVKCHSEYHWHARVGWATKDFSPLSTTVSDFTVYVLALVQDWMKGNFKVQTVKSDGASVFCTVCQCGKLLQVTVERQSEM